MMSMKKIFFILLLLLIIPVSVYAMDSNTTYDHSISVLRAGGGGGGSGGGGSGGSSGSGTTGNGIHSSYSGSGYNIVETLITNVLILFAMFRISIVFYVKVLRSSINNKKYIKLLGKKDISWNYKDLENQVIDAFYSIQESWTNMDMKPSKKYMSKDLYESFIIKLNFMEMNNKRNVLKNIRLVDIKPISVNDDDDDDKDFVWFYIKGRMIDYIMDTRTDDFLEGSKYSKSFVEFWKFVRKGKNKWVLTKIKQKDELDSIIQ